MTNPVFKRPKSAYWQIQYIDSNGREIRRSSGTEDYEAAVELHRVWSSKTGLTVNELMVRFLTEADIRPKTRACYLGNFRAWQPIIGHLNVETVSENHIKEFVALRLTQVKTSSIRNDLACLSSSFEFGKLLPNGPTKNPARDFNKRQLKPSPARVRYLIADQYERLLATVADPTHRLMVLFGAEAGLRSGEIRNLKVWQADPRRRRITLNGGLETKSGHHRVVPMSDRLTRAIIGYWRSRPGMDAEDYLLTSAVGGKPYAEIGKWWDRARAEAGLTDFHFHDLRHHFASMFVQHGGRLQPLARLLGHQTTKVTERYAHLADQDAADEFRRVQRRYSR